MIAFNYIISLNLQRMFFCSICLSFVIHLSAYSSLTPVHNSKRKCLKYKISKWKWETQLVIKHWVANGFWDMVTNLHCLKHGRQKNNFTINVILITDINECVSNPCQYGTCHDGANGYTCSCKAGFDGVNCETGI